MNKLEREFLERMTEERVKYLFDEYLPYLKILMEAGVLNPATINLPLRIKDEFIDNSESEMIEIETDDITEDEMLDMEDLLTYINMLAANQNMLLDNKSKNNSNYTKPKKKRKK